NETRQQLLIAEKLAAVGELVAGVAHEINNPIAVILGNMEVLEQELGEGVLGVQTEVDLIIKQVFRVRAIVDKLRQYAQPADFGRNVEWTDVNEVVRGTLPLVDYELARKSARLRQELGATLHIQNNQPELQQVLVNLLVNAAQAIDQGGLIRIITTDRGDSEVDIVVEDDGPGIPKENLNRVFDPFFTTKPSGTGLGLSVTYGVVHRYGGSVRVESGAESGARIIVTLPVNPVFDSEEDPATATA
ncbi:MAG: two-component sensor histidine kinase, partial [Gammaproteobacteria bacterium]|nr:two-component sensor histidine kinase [Gammaproteobacteria bacterium]